MKILLGSSDQGKIELLYDTASKELIVRAFERQNTAVTVAQFQLKYILATLARHNVKLSTT